MKPDAPHAAPGGQEVLNGPAASPSVPRLVLLAGLSGSGKSVALNMLEDLGYHTIDNLPIPSMEKVVAVTLGGGSPRYAHLAIGIDPRSSPDEFMKLIAHVEGWRASPHGCTVVYLRTDEAVLTNRYSTTRRRHPFSAGRRDLAASIAAERRALEPLAQLADILLDTTRTGVHELRELVRERVAPESDHPMTLVVESFSYRSGIPEGADLVFDVRCLVNPYWEATLRHLTGHDPAVIEFLQRNESVEKMIRGIEHFLEAWIPAYRASNRSYLTIAIGCTGGRHRSVYVAERLARELAYEPGRILLKHRALDTDSGETTAASPTENP
ncbi:MAG: RNase adapter RapZ [Gammaproteobacteria bacterium]